MTTISVSSLSVAAAAGAVCAVAPATTEPGAAQRALHASWMDKSVDPLRDFYLYVNGNFIRENPIPPAYSSWGQVQILNDRNQDIIHELLQAAAADKSAAPGSEVQKIGDFYASGMDEAAHTDSDAGSILGAGFQTLHRSALCRQAENCSVLRLRRFPLA